MIYFKDKKKKEGYTLDEIIDLENKSGVKFPEAYKEFLLSFGRYNIYQNDMRSGVEPKELQEMQEDAEETLKDDNFAIKNKFWSFADCDGAEQFFFFYLNQSEDPPVFSYFFIPPDGYFVKKQEDSFSEYIKRIYKD